MQGIVINLFLFALIIIIEFVFMFKRARKKEQVGDDDKSTLEIVENKYGNYCKNCGGTISYKHKFCPNCGNAVRK